MLFSTIDEPVALTGNVFRKNSLLQSIPFLILCLPISIDDCSYIYNNLSKTVNYFYDPNATLFLGHLAIAAINGEALLIILTSKDDLVNPSFIHFKNISYISGDNKNYSININSVEKEQNYDFICEGVVDYNKWLYSLNQAHKISKGEIGRKLRFCNIFFNNKECSDFTKVSKNNDYIEENYIEKYNKDKENKIKKTVKSKLSQNKQNEKPLLLSNTKRKEDQTFNQMKSSQSFLPFTGIEEHIFSSDGEDKRPLGNIINQNQKMDEILFETTILPLDHQQYDISSNENINKITSQLNNSTLNENSTNTTYNPTANQKINFMNQPIISNSINVINPNNIKQNFLLNSTSQSKFNPAQSLSISSIQPSDSSATLVNFNSKMNRSSFNMNYDNDLTSLSTIHISSPYQIPTNQNLIPHDLPRHPVFYNPTNSTIYNGINKTHNLIKSSETSPSNSFTRQPHFYNPTPTSPINSQETYNYNLSDINSPPHQSIFDNNRSNPNDVITSTTPHTSPKYPSSIEKSPSSTSSSTRFNRQYEERNKTLPRRTSKKTEQTRKKFQSLPRYNSYKVTITRFKSIFSNNSNKYKYNE